jgi:hypothetical protein
MTDEPSGDTHPESDKAIALGGPIAPSEESSPFERERPEPERAPEPAPEPEPIMHAPIAPEPSWTPPPASAPEPAKRSVVMPVLGLLGFLILAAAIGYLWMRPVPAPGMAAMPPDESGAVTALQSDVATLKTQLAALDSRESSDVAALHSAIAALPVAAPAQTASSTSTPAQTASSTSTPAQMASSASAPAGTASSTAAPAQTASSTSAPAQTASSTPAESSAASPSTASSAPEAALVQMVASLSDHLNQLQSAQATQAQQAKSLPSTADISHLAARVDTISQKASQDDSAIRQDLSLIQQQVATLSGQAQTLTKNAADLPQLSAQADRLSQILRAQDALRAGLPLGTIAHAPPALTRYADSAPPTEAALRLSFADAAKAADKAGEPTPDQGHFWHRVWLRAQSLVMVRQGDHVVLGDPTSAILAHAQTVLEAGDLSGTLAVLDTLSGPAAAAMASWEDQAHALLKAREALTQMAAG